MATSATSPAFSPQFHDRLNRLTRQLAGTQGSFRGRYWCPWCGRIKPSVVVVTEVLSSDSYRTVIDLPCGCRFSIVRMPSPTGREEFLFDEAGSIVDYRQQFGEAG